VRPHHLAAGIVKQLDHRLGRLLGTARVLVDVRTPMNLAVLQPVWGALARDSRVGLTFTAQDADGVAAALGPQLAPRLVPRQYARWRRFDLAVTADFWSDTPVRRCRRRINFFHGVAGKYDLDRPDRLAGADLGRFDRVAFVNEDRRQRYLQAGVIQPERALLVGFPKLDDLVNGTWVPADIRRGLGLDPALGTVLYAPTFSTANSLQIHGEALVGALLATGRNVIVKLHDRTLVPSTQYTGGVDWPARLARFDAHPRFALARAAEAGPYLSAADVLITDHSTVGFEFAVLDRPVIVVDAPGLQHAARIDDAKWQQLRAMSDVVEDLDGLRCAIERAFADPGRLRAARAQARDLFAHPGTATERALAAVYELLDLEPLPAYEVLRRHRYA
jgi:CDP-glycerol glycerophosphotransferase (TagB/SpsB family)